MSKAKGPLFTPEEKKGILSLSLIFFFRMFGLFLILPVFSVLAQEELAGSTAALVGLSMGAYGLTSAVLQIPFGAWSDRYGRKPILAIGLTLFVLGSVWAALADDIYQMIFARLLQGAGAVSAPIFALIADLTRPEVRARANAGLGASVGMSFGLALFIAPFLASVVGLSGIFWVISAMASISLVVLITLVPTPHQHLTELTKEPMRVLLSRVFAIKPLRTINIGAFVCSMGLTVTFFMTPYLLRNNGWDKADWWKIYLPMLLLGGVAMVPAAIFAEVKNKFKEVMIFGSILIGISFIVLIFAWHHEDYRIQLAAAFLFFMAFNMFEPIFPSLVTRMSTPETKGTASGVYNFSQFSGQFMGGAVAGVLFLKEFPFLPLLMLMLSSFFLFKTLGFHNPAPRQRHHGDTGE